MARVRYVKHDIPKYLVLLIDPNIYDLVNMKWRIINLFIDFITQKISIMITFQTF